MAEMSRYVACSLAEHWLEEFQGFCIAEDDDAGNPPEDLPPWTTTPSILTMFLRGRFMRFYRSIAGELPPLWWADNVRVWIPVSGLHGSPQLCVATGPLEDPEPPRVLRFSGRAFADE